MWVWLTRLRGTRCGGEAEASAEAWRLVQHPLPQQLWVSLIVFSHVITSTIACAVTSRSYSCRPDKQLTEIAKCCLTWLWRRKPGVSINVCAVVDEQKTCRKPRFIKQGTGDHHHSSFLPSFVMFVHVQRSGLGYSLSAVVYTVDKARLMLVNLNMCCLCLFLCISIVVNVMWPLGGSEMFLYEDLCHAVLLRNGTCGCGLC